MEGEPLLAQETQEPAAAPAADAPAVNAPIPNSEAFDANAELKPLTADDALDVPDTMRRSCTDIPCCLLLLLALTYLGMLHHSAFTEGDPRRLWYGKDHASNVCGVTPGYEDYPYVYFPMKEWPGQEWLQSPSQALVLSTQLTKQMGVCTKACPDNGVEKHRKKGLCKKEDEEAGYCNWYGPENSVANIRNRYCIFQDPKSVVQDGMLCRDVKGEAMAGVTDLVNETNAKLENLRAVIIDPDGALALDNVIKELKQEGEIAQTEVGLAVEKSRQSCEDAAPESQWEAMLADMLTTRDILFMVPVITLCLGFAYFLFLRFCAGCVIWSVIFTVIGGSAFGSWHLWQKYNEQMLENLEDDAWYSWYGALGCGILAITLAIVTACSLKTLKMAAAVMKTVALFLIQSPSVLLTVPMMLIFSAGWLLYMMTSGLFLVSTLTIHPAENVAMEPLRYEVPESLQYSILYHLLLTLWINAIFTGLLIIGLAISVRRWYFAKPDPDSGRKQTEFGMGFRSVGVAFRFHIGTAAFGGLILAIVQMLRIILKYVEKQMKDYSANATMAWMIKCLDWFLWCMQKIVELVNQVAYIICGLKGDGFFQSAKRAIGLMMEHPQRFFILHGVGIALEWLGILLSVTGSVLFSYYYMSYANLFPQLRSPFVPMAMCILISGLTAKVFFTLFTASTDAFFFCFIFDEEVAKITGEGAAKYAPEELKAFLDTGGENEDGKSRGCCG